MREKSDVVRGWLRKAASDMVTLDAALGAGAFDAACFHAQQAAEKYLKGFLAFHEVPFPYTRNLADLTELCARIDASFRSLTPIASELTPYAVRLRYDDSFWPPPETANQARVSALMVRDSYLTGFPKTYGIPQNDARETEMNLTTDLDTPRSANPPTSAGIRGQYNLFTGHLEPLPRAPAPAPEEAWLFDPDFGLVLPDDTAGKEVLVEPGITLQFPIGDRLQRIGNRERKPGDREQVTRDREQGAADVAQGSPSNPAAFSESRTPDTEPGAIFGNHPFVADKPRVAKTEDAAQLVLSGFGIYLGKKSERLQIKLNGKVAKGADGSAYEFPLFRISEVVIASRGVSISSDLVREFCERGIRLSFVEPSGRPYAMLTSPILTATVESRREQLLAYNDARGLEFARIIVRGKIRNQRHLLLYCAKYLKQSDPERYATLVQLAQKLRQLEKQARAVGNRGQDVAQGSPRNPAVLPDENLGDREQGTGEREGVTGDRLQGTPAGLPDVSGANDPRAVPGNLSPVPSLSDHRQALMGMEGVAGRLYWQGFKTIVESKAEFMGRVHRGADDVLNALLNYGYGILYAHVWGAVVNAGLEPFAGFLHVDRPGKPSLVLDLVEEFRQPVVDRTVIAFVNLGQTAVMKEGMLDEDSRRAIAEKILQRLSSPEPFRGQQFQVRSIIQMQARSLVSFLRGKGKYKPFSFRW
jgi:CRISP-associated protein Cas1